MDLTQLADIGEFIGGVAVLLTLVYLAVQVRGNTQAEQAETYRSLIQDLNRSILEPMRDPALVPILRRASADFSSLSGDDQMVAGAFYASMMSLGQLANSLRRSGNIDAEFASTMDGTLAGMLRVPGVATWWSSVEGAFAPSFCSHLREILDSEDCPPPFTEFMPWFAESAGSAVKETNRAAAEPEAASD